MIGGDTIAAIATPSGPGGIGVVRLSGPDALRIASKIAATGDGALTPRVATLCDVEDRENGALLDRCLVTWFRGPNSYTGEDVVEFSCHCSAPVLRRLMELLAQNGARPAAAGEFTMRAVLNGRMDLTQAEAVNRLVRAKTLLQAERAVAQLDGAVGRRIALVDELLTDATARMGAAVDFADEEEEFISRSEAKRILERVKTELTDIIASFGRADLLREGAVVVIAGAANVGKSTLFNALLGHERAIVDEEPGTTRDYIAETIDMEGVPLTLVDTAGLRDSKEGVEIKGMRRTEERIGEADGIVYVAEHGKGIGRDERDLLHGLEERGKKIIVVLNKADISKTEKGNSDREAIKTSAVSGEGIDKLRDAIASMLGAGGMARESAESVLITEVRQQQLFRKTTEAVDRALELIGEERPDELALEEMRLAMDALGEITGKKTTDDLMRRVFENFCVGK